jgi:hypothetical protein
MQRQDKAVCTSKSILTCINFIYVQVFNVPEKSLSRWPEWKARQRPSRIDACRSHASKLLDYFHPTLDRPGMDADAMRRKLHPKGVVTYIIDRNINYTNFCTGTLCASIVRSRARWPPRATSSIERFLESRRNREMGGTGVLMQGGPHLISRSNGLSGCSQASSSASRRYGCTASRPPRFSPLPNTI